MTSSLSSLSLLAASNKMNKPVTFVLTHQQMEEPPTPTATEVTSTTDFSKYNKEENSYFFSGVKPQLFPVQQTPSSSICQVCRAYDVDLCQGLCELCESLKV